MLGKPTTNGFQIAFLNGPEGNEIVHPFIFFASHQVVDFGRRKEPFGNAEVDISDTFHINTNFCFSNCTNYIMP